MDNRIIELYINSFLDRIENENDSASKSFTVLLPQGSEIQLLPTEQQKKIHFKVFNLQVPNVLYNFPKKTSRLWFDTTPNSTPTVVGFQIDTNRVYATPSALMSELESKSVSAGLDISFNYDDTTKKVSMTNNEATAIRLISSFRYATRENILTFEDMNDRLGFSEFYLNTTIAGSGGVLTGNGFLNMNRSNAYFLTLDEAGSYYQQTIAPAKPNSRRIVAQVSGGSYGTLSTFSYVSSEWFNLPSSQRIQSLRFSVLDDEYDAIDTINFPITISCQIKIE